MFDVGIPELILILVVALVVFGPGKLPEIGAALGKAIGDFRRASQGIRNEIQSVKDSIQLEPEDEMRTRLITEENAKAATEAAASSAPSSTEPAPPATETTS